MAGFSLGDDARTIYGGVMDWALDAGTATVFALHDGTASLYLSGGGGVIGGGSHQLVRHAGQSFIRAFEPFLADMAVDIDGELPHPGMTDLRALTSHGRLVVRAPTDDFGTGRHPMSAVFHAGQALIAALRQITDQPPPGRAGT